MIAVRICALVAACALLAGCGGAGARAVPIVAATHAASSASVAFAITVPVPSGTPYLPVWGHAAHRHAKYVSYATTSVTIDLIDGTTATRIASQNVSSPGTAVTVTASAPSGTDTFRIELLDGYGNVLSRATTTVVVTPGSNAIAVTALGVPTFVAFAPSTLAPEPGHAGTITLGAAVYDASGVAITGTFDTPVTLSLNGPGAAHFSLSAASLVSSAAASAVTLTYDGAGSAAMRLAATIGTSATRVGAAAFHPNAAGAEPGAALLVADLSGSVTRLDLTSGAKTTIVPASATQATALAASPRGDYAIAGFSDGSIVEYDEAARTLSGGHTATGAATVDALAFSENTGTAYALVGSSSAYAIAAIAPAAGGATVAPLTALPTAALQCGGIASGTNAAGGDVLVIDCYNAVYAGTLTGGFTALNITADGPPQPTFFAPYPVYAGTFNATTFANTGLVGIAGAPPAIAATYATVFGPPLAFDTADQLVATSSSSGLTVSDLSVNGADVADITLASPANAAVFAPAYHSGGTFHPADAELYASDMTAIAGIDREDAIVLQTYSGFTSVSAIGAVL
jgi:hypothetical protein